MDEGSNKIRLSVSDEEKSCIILAPFVNNKYIFPFLITKGFKLTKVFGPEKPLQPSLIFLDKTKIVP